MNEEPEQEEFDDADADALLEAEVDVDEDLESKLRDLERTSRRSKGAKVADPAWRKLERMREERETAALIMDLEDYDIGLADADADADSDAELAELDEVVAEVSEDADAYEQLEELPLRQVASG